MRVSQLILMRRNSSMVASCVDAILFPKVFFENTNSSVYRRTSFQLTRLYLDILTNLKSNMSYLNHMEHLSLEALNKENAPPSALQAITNPTNHTKPANLKQSIMKVAVEKKVNIDKESKYPSSMDAVEPLLIESKNRFVLFPIADKEVCTFHDLFNVNF